MASKPKPDLALWLVAQRDGHGESVADVAKIVDRKDATVRGWEAGRPPKSDDPTIGVLERHWGSVAPKDQGEVQSDLAASIRLQAASIDRMTQAINVAALAVLTSQAGLDGGQQALGALLARLAAGETLTELARSLQHGPE